MSLADRVYIGRAGEKRGRVSGDESMAKWKETEDVIGVNTHTKKKCYARQNNFYILLWKDRKGDKTGPDRQTDRRRTLGRVLYHTLSIR